MTFWDGAHWKPFSLARRSLGADVYLCCPGPSLADVDPKLLERPGVVVIAVNTAYPHIPRPNYWIGTDHPHCFAKTLLWEPFTKFLRSCWREQRVFAKPIKECPSAVFFDLDPNAHPLEMFNRRTDNFVAPAPLLNSFETALYLAIWMGAERIHLVGCDFGGATDYHDDRVLTPPQRSGNRRLYKDLVHRLMHHHLEAMLQGIDLVSCTPDSPVNGFMPFVPIEEAVAASVTRVPDGWAPQLTAADAALCRWRGEPTDPQGVVVGVIQQQTWMLEWWMENFRRHNPATPVAFADFGLSEDWVKWCEERGQRIGVRAAAGASGWFRKPFAILQSPFEKTLWLDVDTEVRGSLDTLFDQIDKDTVLLAGGAECVATGYGSSHAHHWYLMVSKDASNECQGRVGCSGIVGVQRGNDLICEWAVACTPPREHTYRGDHEVLGVTVWRRQPKVHQLLGEEFTLAMYPTCETPLVMHHAGYPAKSRLWKDLAMARGQATLPSAQVDDAEALILRESVRALAADRKTIRILEIGTAKGGTAVSLMREVVENGCRFRYVGVEPRGETAFPDDLSEHGDITILQGESQVVADQVRALLPEIDLLFIDGCHCRRCVQADWDNFAPLVMPGGYVAFHDTKVGRHVRQEHSAHGGHDVRPVYVGARALVGWSDAGEYGTYGLGRLRRVGATSSGVSES